MIYDSKRTKLKIFQTIFLNCLKMKIKPALEHDKIIKMSVKNFTIDTQTNDSTLLPTFFAKSQFITYIIY